MPRSRPPYAALPPPPTRPGPPRPRRRSRTSRPRPRSRAHARGRPRRRAAARRSRAARARDRRRPVSPRGLARRLQRALAELELDVALLAFPPDLHGHPLAGVEKLERGGAGVGAAGRAGL